MECTVERFGGSEEEKLDDGADDGDSGDASGSDDKDADSTDDDGEGSSDENEGNAEKVDLHLSGGLGIVKAGRKRRLGGNPSLESTPRVFVIAGVMVVALILFFLSLRRRRKETGKMN